MLVMASDGRSRTPGWVEGAAQTALNAVRGIVHRLGGHSDKANPDPGDQFEALKPVRLTEYARTAPARTFLQFLL